MRYELILTWPIAQKCHPEASWHVRTLRLEPSRYGRTQAPSKPVKSLSCVILLPPDSGDSFRRHFA